MQSTPPPCRARFASKVQLERAWTRSPVSRELAPATSPRDSPSAHDSVASQRDPPTFRRRRVYPSSSLLGCAAAMRSTIRSCSARLSSRHGTACKTAHASPTAAITEGVDLVVQGRCDLAPFLPASARVRNKPIESAWSLADGPAQVRGRTHFGESVHSLTTETKLAGDSCDGQARTASRSWRV